ncbi:MAG: extracellular solute-binding protein [Lacrimispora celerecrescens]|nr:extracellular solute-binding protein [Lacrimispora celerecrescens]
MIMTGRKGKRIACSVLAAMMALSLAACKGSGGQPDTAKGTSDSAAEVSDAASGWTSDNGAEITIMLFGDNTPDADNIVIQELEKKTDTKISIIYLPESDYNTKLSTMIAAGTVPDIFWCGNLADAADYKKNGILANVEELLSQKAPNVMEDTKDMIRKVSVNEDGIYLVPSPAKNWANNVNIRTDWLKNLGLEMPDDLESFREVMRAFTYDDPDGNGQKDTYGYAFNLNNLTNEDGRAFQSIFGAYGIPKGKTIELEDGTVTTWVKHPRFLEAIAYIKTLIDDGLTEPDYVTIPQMDMFGKLWTGVAGCMEWECVGPTNNWMPVRYTEDPVPVFGFPVLKGPDGKSGVPAVYPELTSGWVFSASSKNLEGAARIADYCMSPEGSDLLFLGVEDTMYRWTDQEKGQFEYLDQYKDNATHRAAGGFCYWLLFKPSDNAQYRTLNEQTREGVNQAWDQGIDWAYVTATSEVRVENGADMDQVINEMLADLLTTKDDIKTVFDNYMEEWENVGGSDWEKEVTELWKEQNR